MATINGTFNSLIGGTISGTVGTPGPQGPAGPAGSQGSQGIPGVGVPAGGLANQVLAKVDGVSYNTHWIDQSAPDFISSVSSPLAVTTGNLTINLAGYATETFVTSQGYITSAALSPYLLSSTAASTYQTIAGMAGYATESFVTSQGYITASALTGYATESWVTSQGYLTSSALTGYALLSGATFTGKVNFTPVAGASGLNVGIGGTSAASTTNGDLWIATGGVNLNYRDGNGAWRIVAITTSTNTFSSPQIVDTTATTPALRVTQKGTGNAIQVEDSTTPDSTAFVVDQFGKVGIGVAPDTTAALKVDTNGIMFGDGTTQTTAASGGSYSANNATADMITASILYNADEGMGSLLCDTRVETSSGSGRYPTFLNGLNWSLVSINGETVSWGGNGEFTAPYYGGPGIPWYVSYNGAQASRPFGNFGSP